MDNKGQTLVAFVIILPLILLILLGILDYGLLSIKKQEITSALKDSIRYGINNKSNDKVIDDMKYLIYNNIDKTDIELLDINNNEYTSIHIKVKYHSLFNFLNINKSIDLSYKGIIIDNEIRIEKS